MKINYFTFFLVSVKTPLHSFLFFFLSLRHIFVQEKKKDGLTKQGKSFLPDVPDSLACNYCHTSTIAALEKVQGQSI